MSNKITNKEVAAFVEGITYDHTIEQLVDAAQKHELLKYFSLKDIGDIVHDFGVAIEMIAKECELHYQISNDVWGLGIIDAKHFNVALVNAVIATYDSWVGEYEND